MTTREHQKRLISKLRRSLVASSVVGSLGIAGYLGFTTQAASPTDGTSTDTTSTDTTTGSASYADQTGGSPDLSPGSGDSHATASGS
ncbi:hypothetical protein ABIE44_001144 [Marmoricola sp. OAE513]|uniref:hypothetical protein n=1 Tax=Marmoricola sp. OAE513 TaxID=2817894 RepID=UPI001AE85F3C